MAGKQFQDMLDENGQVKEGSLKNILNNTIETIEDNKTQIFDIYEAARTEVETSRAMLADIKKQAGETIDKVDELAKQEQQEKQRLVKVSGNFNDYTEDDIRACYESVAKVQVSLGVEREKEKRLREQRDKLELRLRHMQGILQQAERMTVAVGSVLTFLSAQITGVVWKIEAVQKDKLVGASIIKAQEEERYRLSREIHDGPAQDMANLIFQTSICERLVERDPDECKRTIQELRGQIRECLSGIRQVIFDMRPMALDDLGLAPALRQLVEKMAERGILGADYSVEGTEYALPKHIEIAIFRIVQEALNNVAHHSGVRKAKVNLRYTPTAVAVRVEDGGKGFQMDAAPSKKQEDGEEEREEHFGILGMRERAKIIGAEFSVTSSPGKGTKVQLRMPYQSPAADRMQPAASRHT